MSNMYKKQTIIEASNVNIVHNPIINVNIVHNPIIINVNDQSKPTGS